MKFVSLLGRTLPVALLLGLVGCTDDPVTPTPPVVAAEPTWEVVGSELEGALLSISGTSPEDVWAVGGDAKGRDGLVLHFDGTDWTRVASNTPYDLWWVHALAPDDVFISGSGGTILRFDGTTLVRQATPGLAAHTVFGLWASGPSDVWAVGGVSGRYGFIWHFDGATWQDVPLPDAVPLNNQGELPALFKVWGRGPDDVYVVGGDGLLLHYDGNAWAVVPTATDELLFTVHGDDDEVVIVGGGNNGVVLSGDGDAEGPSDAPLLQGVHVGPDGTFWACGARGTIYRRLPGKDWAQVENVPDLNPESLHAIWVDPEGSVWTVGGGVLSPALDQGVVLRGRPSSAEEIATVTPPEDLPPPDTSCPADRVDIAPGQSIARRWNELLLDSIRRDIPRPTNHSRNLFHTSVAIYDAWAAYDVTADGYVVQEKLTATDVAEARRIAISYAAYRVMHHRYEKEVGGTTSVDCYDAFMAVLGLDPDDTHATGDDPIALGNRIGAQIIAQFADDGANEANGYADTTSYAPVNAPLFVDRAGTQAAFPYQWQELNLAQAETQNGIIIDAGLQGYIGPNWGYVTPFALPGDPEGDGTHHDWPDDPADAPIATKQAWAVEVIQRTAELDHDDGTTIDISPASLGNNTLGTNDGAGHGLNPVTNQAYTPNSVPRGDFGRVLAEFWADGPSSETPPGHWNTIANRVADTPGLERLLYGEGTPVDALEWDVKVYLALNGAVHDAAITAWGLKRKYTSSRPITIIRHMAGLGQSTDPGGPSYDPEGLPLVAGTIELITDESAAPGQRHHHLRWWKGELALRAWRGEPGRRDDEFGGVGWIRAVDWIPYQRRTFVTPAFPGFVSGHSTFSRAAAEVLTRITGSPYFPGGLGEYVAGQNEYLVFEDGPSVEVRLQWASYYDASDQAGQSRLWGGIHVSPDDLVGRELGSLCGVDAADLARTYFEGTAIP